MQGGTFTLADHAKYLPGKPARTSFSGGLSVDGLSVFAPGFPGEVLGVERFVLEKLTAVLSPSRNRSVSSEPD